MPDYNVVQLIDATKKQPEGNAVVLLPGGKKATGVAQMDAISGSGATHKPIFSGGTVAASGANTRWGDGRHIAPYPYVYEAGPTATGLAQKMLG
jgi:hypothetical protein